MMRRRAFVQRMTVAAAALMYGWRFEGHSPLEQLQRDMAQFENPPVEEVKDVMRYGMMDVTSFGDDERRYM